MTVQLEMPPGASPAISARRTGNGRRRSAYVNWIPGVAVAFAVAFGAQQLHRLVPVVNAVLVCIVLGALIGNLVTIPATLRPGLAVAARRVLRIGIVVLGLQLSLRGIAALGPGVLLLVVAVVGGGIAGTMVLGRLLGVPFTQRLLIACGFSICGAAAVAAVEGAIDAEEEDVAASVGLVVVFGTIMMAAVPLLARMLGLSQHAGAMLAGASIHEVAQVVAAGALIGPAAVGPAVIVKLARVALLAPVVVMVSAICARRRAAAGTEPAVGLERPPVVPLFLVGFLAASVLTTVVEPGANLLHVAGTVQGLCLGAAMFALGASVHRSVLRRLGLRPAVLGLLSTLLVLAIALTGVLVLA